MQLIPKALRARMLANDRNLPNDIDPVPVVKLFAPGGAATWLLTELDSNDQDRAFGLSDTGGALNSVIYAYRKSLRSISGLATLSNAIRPLSRNFNSRFTPQPHGKPALFQPLKHGSRTPAATQH